MKLHFYKNKILRLHESNCDVLSLQVETSEVTSLKSLVYLVKFHHFLCTKVFGVLMLIFEKF